MLVGINFPNPRMSGDHWALRERMSCPLSSVVWVADSTSQRARWTEEPQKQLLARAEDGDAGAQFRLGAGYEQGTRIKLMFLTESGPVLGAAEMLTLSHGVTSHSAS
jgi:hypothetical protein